MEQWCEKWTETEMFEYDTQNLTLGLDLGLVSVDLGLDLVLHQQNLRITLDFQINNFVPLLLTFHVSVFSKS